MSDIEDVADILRKARRVVVLSGAGLSAESGIATFRDKQVGLWERFDPAELASMTAWLEHPDVVWGWYAWRIGIVRQAKPHAGYAALSRWANHIAPQREQHLTFVTQNVDDLHERAGIVGSEDGHIEGPLHVHGALEAFRCSVCGTPFHGAVEVPDEPMEELEPPICPVCGERVRPGVVWFGEELPAATWNASVDAVTDADAVLVVGTSGLVYPAAMLPEVAAGLGKPCVEINPEPTAVSRFMEATVRLGAAEGLTALVSAIEG